MAHAPSGLIAIWNSSLETIPDGWVLCDGDNSTPDLRELFVVGASLGIPPGQSSGSSAHSHTFTSDPHSHAIVAGTGVAAGAGLVDNTNNASPEGTTDSVANLPPWFSLAYIMKT